MQKTLSILIFVTLGLQAVGQTVTGMVADESHEALIGATILELGTDNGAITDINGHFSLKLKNANSKLVVSYTGFVSDTLIGSGQPMHIMLKESEGQLSEVTITSTSTFIDQIKPMHNEVISELELTKAACCNLSESFETNASVDVSYSDAVTGTKAIRMLGLDGRYVQINRENMPHIRGLATKHGLNFVPGTWIQAIDLGKGTGSVVNGYESMTGQINLEFKKPDSEKLYLNAYVNSFGRVELNANHLRSLNDKWAASLLVHGNYLGTEIDRNDDGFMDLPKSRQVNVLNRYKYAHENLRAQVGIHLMYDEKAGGQLGFGFGDDFRTSPQYGFSHTTSRAEVFGKVGLLFPHKPYKGWGFIYSGAYLNMNGGYGRDNYDGTETTLYGNVIYQNIIGDSKHQYRTGVSILYDDFKENYMDSTFSRQEVVPGAYFEYTYLPNDQFTAVAGVRTDFHNLYGTYFTPRLHLRYQLNDAVTARAAIGRGYRTPNVIMENSQVLVSSRQLIIQEAPDPEVAWNMGGSVTSEIPVGEKKLGLTVDYFYTHFENQLIYDMDQNSSQLRVYNLDGQSYAHSFQIEGSYELLPRLNMKAAYKYYDVQSTINNQLMQVPFAARDRVFLNLGYETKYEKWQIDATGQWYGRKRLPDTSDKPVDLQRGEYSPNFFLMNAQVTRNFRWGSVYLGGENIFDFRQDNPIIDPENPFGNDFDASIVWGPVAGRVVYAGVRFKLKQ